MKRSSQLYRVEEELVSALQKQKHHSRKKKHLFIIRSPTKAPPELRFNPFTAELTGFKKRSFPGTDTRWRPVSTFKLVAP